jgi:hypothetical protein
MSATNSAGLGLDCKLSATFLIGRSALKGLRVYPFDPILE